MGNQKVKAKKLKIKVNTEDGQEVYVLGDNQPIPDQVSPNPSPADIANRLSGLGNLNFVGAIFHSHSSPG
jgi:hypothetical protein